MKYTGLEIVKRCCMGKTPICHSQIGKEPYPLMCSVCGKKTELTEDEILNLEGD